MGAVHRLDGRITARPQNGSTQNGVQFRRVAPPMLGFYLSRNVYNAPVSPGPGHRQGPPGRSGEQPPPVKRTRTQPRLIEHMHVGNHFGVRIWTTHHKPTDKPESCLLG